MWYYYFTQTRMCYYYYFPLCLVHSGARRREGGSQSGRRGRGGKLSRGKSRGDVRRVSAAPRLFSPLGNFPPSPPLPSLQTFNSNFYLNSAFFEGFRSIINTNFSLISLFSDIKRQDRCLYTGLIARERKRKKENRKREKRPQQQ